MDALALQVCRCLLHSHWAQVPPRGDSDAHFLFYLSAGVGSLLLFPEGGSLSSFHLMP